VTAARAASRRQEPDHHHLQEVVGGDPHHPQDERSRVPHGAKPTAGTSSRRPQQEQRTGGTGASPPADARARRDAEGRTFAEGDGPDDRNAPSTPRRCVAEPPPPGALRPLARAFLALAAETHAVRSEVHRTVCREHERTLRMPEAGGCHPVRLSLRLGLASPATPERTGRADASSHVETAPTPPVKNPDCIGDCA
jgi:hypothetical protein